MTRQKETVALRDVLRCSVGNESIPAFQSSPQDKHRSTNHNGAPWVPEGG